MTMTKGKRILVALNDEFREVIINRMRDKHGIEVENTFDLFGSMRLITRRVDGEDFTPEQHADLGSFSDGFGEAMRIAGRFI